MRNEKGNETNPKNKFFVAVRIGKTAEIFEFNTKANAKAFMNDMTKQGYEAALGVEK